MNDTQIKRMAISFTLNFIRNSNLEDLHCGITPGSKLGDYSDVKVISPYGEIPWERLSRISDAEMKVLMKDITRNIYYFFKELFDKGDLTEERIEMVFERLDFMAKTALEEWDDPSK